MFVVVSPNYPVGTKAGLIDEYDKSPFSAIDVGGGVICAQVGVGIIPDEVNYFIIEQPGSGEFTSGTANCADIGNSRSSRRRFCGQSCLNFDNNSNSSSNTTKLQ